MAPLIITHYFVHGTDPWQNIMLLPEAEAFSKAAELAAAHEGMESFGRFADFVHYYPLRKAADEWVRKEFIRLGGRPRLEHPYSFVLGESNYLKKWFSQGDSLQIPLDRVPEDQVSFTLGDSCAKFFKKRYPGSAHCGERPGNPRLRRFRGKADPKHRPVWIRGGPAVVPAGISVPAFFFPCPVL